MSDVPGTATPGDDYYGTLAASGGVSPYTWSVASGSLPAGLSLQSDGEIYGEPRSSGTFNFTIDATDGATPPDVVATPLTVDVSPEDPFGIYTTSLDPAVEGQNYQTYLYAAGGVGPYTWSVIAGSLPPGLTLQSDGELSGEPVASGSFSLTVEATDSTSPTPNVATVPLTLSVAPSGPLAVAVPSLPSGTEGQSYEAALEATGGITPYVWSIASGSLPTGMTLNAAGELSGIPTASGTFTFTASTTDAATPPDTAADTLTLVITPAAPLAIVGTTLQPGTAGDHYEGTLNATGGVGPYTWTLASGSLPIGLVLDSDGEVSGYVADAGTYSFTAAATDSGYPSPEVTFARISLTFGPALPLSVQPTTLQVGTEGQPYKAVLTASGGVGPDTWAVLSGELPGGLTLQSNGVLTGQPTTSGTYSFKVEATDSAQPTPEVAYANIGVTISGAGYLYVEGWNPLATATEGESYTASLAASGGVAPYAWSILSGTLPAGLSLDPSGKLSGVPTVSGMFSFTAEATDSSTPTPESAQAALTLSVSPATPIEISTTSLPSATEGEPFGAQLAAMGGIAPYSWAVVSGTLPEGLSLSSAGSFIGSPTAVGTYTFSVGVTDSLGHAPSPPTVALTLQVDPAPLNLVPVVLPTAQVGATYSGTVHASSGTAPLTWSVLNGALPAGLSLDTSSGVISGIPETAGEADRFTLKVTDSSEPLPRTGLLSASIIVAPAPLAVTSSSLPAATEGIAYATPVALEGGIAPYTVAISSGSLPAGLSMNASGEITGTPTTAGQSTFTVVATDGSVPIPETVTESLTLTVNPPASLESVVTNPPGGSVGASYYEDLGAAGGVAPYTWSLQSGSLPPGLSLDAYGAISGTPTGSGSFSFVLSISDSALAPDTAVVPLTIVIATNGPTVNVSADPADGAVPLRTSLVVVANQPANDPLTYSVDFGDGTPDETGSIAAPYVPLVLTHVYQSSGSFTAQVSVVDAITDLTTSSTAAVEVAAASAQPPVASLSVDQSEGIAPLGTTFTVQGSDSSGTPLTYTLNFGDGSTPSTGSVIGSVEVTHTYSIAGSYKAVLDVSNGQLDTSKTVSIFVATPQPTLAVAGDDQVTSVGESVQFDASGSQPAGAISSYKWDFGDRTPHATGEYPMHTYASVGTYTATLTVTANGSSSSASIAVTVNPAPTDSGLEITITGNGAPLVGAEALVEEGNGESVSGTSDGSGVATLNGLPDGTYTAYVYAEGFVPATVSTSISGGVGSGAINLVPGALAQASLTDQELTEAQILAAGINPGAPGNQYVDEFSVNLGFVAFDGYVCGGTKFCGNTGGSGGAGGGGWTATQNGGYWDCSSASNSCYDVSPEVVGGQPTLDWMIIPGTASFLKQFFNVQMMVQNLAPSSFTLTNGSATLEIPPGLSLAPTPTPQQLTQGFPDIAGNTSASVNWIVRGDQEGNYDLSATYSALLQPLNVPVTLTALSYPPLKIWGSSALSMTIDADATALTGYPYLVRVGLKNVADIPIYNPVVTLSHANNSAFIFQPQQQLSYGTDKIDPGDTFWTGYYRLVPDATVNGPLDLSSSFVDQLGGNPGAPNTVETHPAVPLDQVPEIAMQSESGGARLTWQAPTASGITGYRIFYTATPDTPFGADPLVTVSSSTLSVFIAHAKSGYYAVSAVAGGKATMYSPRVGFALEVDGYETLGSSSNQKAPGEYSLPIVSENSGTIVLDPNQAKQKLDGFGVTLTNSSAAVLESLPKSSLTNALDSLFDPISGAGISMIRLPMGANDFSDGPPNAECSVAAATCSSTTAEYTYDDIPQAKSSKKFCQGAKSDPNLVCFSVYPYDQDIIDILQQALRINPDLTIIASPWSAPTWMKTSKSFDASGDNTLNTNIKGIESNIYSVYANYFVKYIQAYASAGITINYVTPQNEPGSATSNYPGMILSPTGETTFVKALALALAHNKLSTKILAYDWNWNNVKTCGTENTTSSFCWTTSQLNSAVATMGSTVAGIAWHCYGNPKLKAQGNVGAQLLFPPPLTNFITECSGSGPNAGTGPNGIPNFAANLDWDSQHLIVGGVDDGASGVQFFNLALNSGDGPHDGGCANGRGAITVNTSNGLITDNVEYWLLTRQSASSPGSTVIANTDSSGAGLAACESGTGLCVLSATNPDGTTGLYVDNPTPGPLRFTLDDEGYGFSESNVPAESVESYRWSNP